MYMVKLRHVIQQNGSKPALIAEASIPDEMVDQLKTKALITDSVVVTLSTWVYWFDGGYPPKPVMLGCPTDLRAKVIHKEAANYVNCKADMDWHFELNVKGILNV